MNSVILKKIERSDFHHLSFFNRHSPFQVVSYKHRRREPIFAVYIIEKTLNLQTLSKTGGHP